MRRDRRMLSDIVAILGVVFQPVHENNDYDEMKNENDDDVIKS